MGSRLSVVADDQSSLASVVNGWSSEIRQPAGRMERQFEVGKDTLARGCDGMFHVGKILKVDEKNKRCFISLESEEEEWILYQDIQYEGCTEDPDIICCLCRDGKSQPPNEIVLCDDCGLGFHQKCHNPMIRADILLPDVEWLCRLCYVNRQTKKNMNSVGGGGNKTISNISNTMGNRTLSSSASTSSLGKLKKKKSSKLKKTSSLSKLGEMSSLSKLREAKKNQNASKVLTPSQCKTVKPPQEFPYKESDLAWDDNHMTNSTGKYCYCGNSGDWYFKMIQCRRCSQWFHEGCTSCIKKPLVIGDRFYVFVCAICNSGQEYIRRLEIGWDEIAHLAIFHLSMVQHIKYFDINEVLVPWTQKNWNRLLLPRSWHHQTDGSIKNSLLNVLNNHQHKYKSGKEIKKRFTWWGLRKRVPPTPPPIGCLKGEGPVTDDMVDDAISKCSSTKRNRHENLDPLPLKQDRKRKASGDGDEFRNYMQKAKKPRFNKSASTGSLPNVLTTKSSNSVKTTSKPSVPVTQQPSGNNNQHSSPVPSEANKLLAQHVNNNNNDSPVKISLDHIIPTPRSFDGLNHPFKTILERNQEIEHTKLKERLLTSYSQCDGTDTPEEITISTSESGGTGGVDSPMETESDTTSLSLAESTTVEPPKPRLLRRASLLPRIKRRKRGRPTNAELQALQARMSAAAALGLHDSHIVQSVATLIPTKTPEKRTRTKNVVDKSTLDGMCEKEVPLNHLKTSVNHYFGAANRLATGEGFRVLGRRVSPEGRVQYLVEWEGGVIG